MQKFFINELEFNNLTLKDDLIYQSFKVLRFKIGDKFIIGFNDKSYLVKITLINQKELKYEIIEELNINNELDLDITIIQGYPKGDKIEDIIKYGSTLGANSFIPCYMERTQFKIDMKKQENKIERFNKIAREACEQSMRTKLSKVEQFINFKDINYNMFDLVYICYEEEAKDNNMVGFKESLKELKSGSKIAFLIGPEGGISEKEIAYLKTLNNTKFISLGKRILRTETASLYCLSAVSYERELK